MHRVVLYLHVEDPNQQPKIHQALSHGGIYLNIQNKKEKKKPKVSAEQ